MTSNQELPRPAASLLRSPALVPFALAVVAILHFGTAYKAFLVPWKGGGFAMFATTDRPDNRFLLLTATDSEGKKHVVRVPPVGLASSLGLEQRFLARVIALPTYDRLSRVAMRVLQTNMAPSSSVAERLPARLAHSQYGALLRDADARRPVLEIVARPNIPSTIRLREVRARVMKLTIDRATQRLTMTQVGPSVSASKPHEAIVRSAPGVGGR